MTEEFIEKFCIIMEIEMVEGCMCDSLTIDGVEEINLTDEQRQKYIEEICEGLKKVITPRDLNYLLQHITYNYGKSELLYDKPCSCCGDYVYSYKLKL
jgi:hypothetical protein